MSDILKNSGLFRVDNGISDGLVDLRSSALPVLGNGSEQVAGPEVDAYRVGTQVSTPDGRKFVRLFSTGTRTADWVQFASTKDLATLQSAIQTEINNGGTLANAIVAALGLQSDGSIGDDFLGTNYVASATTVVDAIKKLDTQAKVEADAIAAEATRATGVEAGLQTQVSAVASDLATEVARAQSAEQSETASRTAAVAAAQAAAADAVSTETAARLAGDAAATSRMDGIQAELNATQEAVGLTAEGAYEAPTNSAYLGETTSVKTALQALDAATSAEAAARASAVTALQSALANETQLREAGDTQLQAQIQAYVDGKVTDVSNAEAGEVAARIAADAAIQSELDQVEAAIGLADDGKLIPIAGTNYMDGASTVFGAASALDNNLHRVDVALADETTRATGAEATLTQSVNAANLARQQGDAAIQQELDVTQAGAGLETDGQYAAPTGSHYLDAATSLKDADLKLDAAVKVVADAAAANTAALNNLSTSSSGAVAAETAAREAADTTLQSNIDAEASAREAADATLQAAVALLDRKQTQTGALLLAARKESSSTGVAATAVAVDQFATQQVEAAKWTVYAKGQGANVKNRVVFEVLALHNGTATADADSVDVTSYAKLQTGNGIAGLAISVDLVGTGASQRLELNVSSADFAVDVFAVRERLPGLDVDTTDGINNWVVADPNFYFGAQSYTADPSIVF